MNEKVHVDQTLWSLFRSFVHVCTLKNNHTNCITSMSHEPVLIALTTCVEAEAEHT